MGSASVVLDTRFLAQGDDTARWEDRFDLLVNELRDEFGPHFDWISSTTTDDVDIVFVLYPPGHHARIVTERILENYIKTYSGRIAQVHVIIIGRNSKDAKVNHADVIDLVNDQCTSHPIKAEASRVLRPEELDDAVRTTLVRLYTRQQSASLQPPDEQPLADSSGVIERDYYLQPPYGSSDL